jgi:hypothetical protein
MKGYFTRKPLNGEEVKAAIREARRMHVGATEIEVLERVVLPLDEYLHFLDNLSSDYDFLKPYADESMFMANGAKCVLVGAPGQPWLAVCLEGYAYPRYCAWPFADKYQLAALLSD